MKRQIGVAIVGAGKIGRHRARLAVEHAGVRHVAIADIEAGAAGALAEEVRADTWAADVEAVVRDPAVDVVVVSTPERSHLEPVVAALEAGKPTLVEKPLALTLDDADVMIAAAARAGVPLWVGYSMRYARRYAVGKEHVAAGSVGSIIGGLARCYDTVAVGEAILKRSPAATAAMDILTYLVDVVGWYHPAPPVEVVARSHGSSLRNAGHESDDLTVALVTHADGAVFEYATSYALPSGYPINGMASRIELLGTDGVLFITEDHGDQVLFSERGHRNAYVDQTLQLTFLGSRTSGDWAQGRMFGRVANETRAWLDHLTTGSACHITSAAEARTTLSVTLAIDHAARTGDLVQITPGG